MKQFLFLATMTIGCSIAALFSPFWGVVLYYAWATLRPQYLWAWALPVEVRWSLIAAVVVFLSVAVHLGDLMRGARLNGVFWMMVLYSILILFSVLGAMNPATAGSWGVEYGKILVMAAIASVTVDRLWQVRGLALVIMAMLGFIAYEINWQYFMEGGRLDVFHKGYGGMDNNGAGMMMAMGVPLALCFAAAPGGSHALPRRIVAGAFGLMLMHAVMMSYSRGAMLATAAAAAWLVLHHRPRWQAAGIGAVVLVAAFVLAGPQIREEFLSSKNYAEDYSAQSKFSSWEAGWKIALDNPIFGAGVRNSGQLTHAYGADMSGRTVHNQFIQIAADSGIPAAMTYVALVALSLWRLGGTRRRCILAAQDATDPTVAGDLEFTAAVCLGIQGSLIAFVLSGMFLSLEMFELPWCLMVLAGVAPVALDRYLDNVESIEPEPQEIEHAPTVPVLARGVHA